MLKIAHRGASGYETENTLAAFEKALKLDAGMVELDVRVCGSGELVVFHDRNLKRMTGVDGLIANTSVGEIKKLTLRGGRKIPTLNELIEFLKPYPIEINLEIKARSAIAALTHTLRRIEKNNKALFERLLVSSFYPSHLAEIKNVFPNLRIGLISFLVRGDLSFIKTHQFYSLHLYKRGLNKKIIERIKKSGAKVFVWTLNQPAEIARFQSWGCQGMFSDYPDRL